MLRFAPGREDVGRLTSQNMPFQMLIPGKGLSTIRAKHHFGLLKEKLAGGKTTLYRTERSWKRRQRGTKAMCL
jgi:hypothetical protein